MDPVHACAGWSILCWIEAHPGLAAWLQAVFSVLAILVAIAAPVMMAAAERRRRQAHLNRQAVRVAGMVSAAIEVLAKPASDREKRQVFGEVGGYPVHIFESAKLALARLDIGTIEHEGISRAIHILSMHLQASENDVSDFAHFADSDDGGDRWASHIDERSQAAIDLYLSVKAAAAPRKANLLTRMRDHLPKKS